ncbi:CD1375 family protein [Virgibacillus sp. W0430]
MLAMLFATYIIRGKWAYADVPDTLKEDVDKILIADDREDLINAE